MRINHGTVRFEAEAEAGPALGGGEAAVEAPAAAEPVEAVEAAAPVEQAPEASLDPLEVQAELEYMRDQYGQLVQYLQQQGATPAQAQAQAQQAGFDPELLNPLDDNFGPNFAQFLSQRDERLLAAIDQRFQMIQAPMLQQQEQQVVAEGEQRLQDILADDITRNGELAADPEADRQARQMVRTLADQLFPEIQARYGATPRAAEIAMSRAADQVRGLLRSAQQAGAVQQANQLATLAGAKPEPGGAGVSALRGVPAAPVSPQEIARKYGRTG